MVNSQMKNCIVAEQINDFLFQSGTNNSILLFKNNLGKIGDDCRPKITSGTGTKKSIQSGSKKAKLRSYMSRNLIYFEWETNENVQSFDLIKNFDYANKE